jgi:hypothetical protein
MVSWYYHCIFGSEKTLPQFTARVRADLAFADFNDIRSNLPMFIDYSFTRQRTPRFSWNDFFDSWYGYELAVHTSYELLRSEAEKELARVCEELGFRPTSGEVTRAVDRFSFEAVSGRPAGSESRGSFLRKGVVGDWRNQFSSDAAKVMAHYVGDRILRLGYETHERWDEQYALQLRSK